MSKHTHKAENAEKEETNNLAEEIITDGQSSENTESVVAEELPQLTVEEELTKKLAELNDKYLRSSAEYDNYRKRTVKERAELLKTAGESVLIGILPVVDDFERALSHLNEATDLEAIKEGITLIHKRFSDFLVQKGVKPIEAKECDFDTDLHEAITKIPAPTPKLKGKVIDCVEKGYTLYDKVIRHSKVVVGE